MSGLGLTKGILDAFVYGNAFTWVVKGVGPDSLLTDCANSRRDAWQNATSVAAMANLQRLKSLNENDVKGREEVFHKLTQILLSRCLCGDRWTG